MSRIVPHADTKRSDKNGLKCGRTSFRASHYVRTVVYFSVLKHLHMKHVHYNAQQPAGAPHLTPCQTSTHYTTFKSLSNCSYRRPFTFHSAGNQKSTRSKVMREPAGHRHFSVSLPLILPATVQVSRHRLATKYSFQINVRNGRCLSSMDHSNKLPTCERTCAHQFKLSPFSIYTSTHPTMPTCPT